MTTYDTDNIGPGPLVLLFVLGMMFFLQVPMAFIGVSALSFAGGYVLSRFDMVFEEENDER